jgi:ABC-type dipeptide/oligopeptide/nickel transport system permease subunit
MTDGVPSAVPSSPLAAPLAESPSVASQRGEAMREIGSFGAAAPADLGVLPRGARVAGPAKGFWRTSFERLIHNRISMAALVVLVLLAIASFSAPLVAQAMGLDRDAMDLTNRYLPPSREHWFGTDEFGRDYFIRILYGGQVSFLMGLGVAAVVLAIAIPLGLLAGYYGGLIDDGFNWVVQIMVCTPILFVLILIVSWIPPTPLSLALLIGLFSWMGNARQARGLTLQIKRSDYVMAARALGSQDGRIMFRHISPNMVSLMLVLAGFDVVAGILAEAGLSFLGLGIRPPIPSWGNMLTNSLNYVFRAPFLVVFPGLAIGLMVLCVYMLTDGLRDAFDPRLKG